MIKKEDKKLKEIEDFLNKNKVSGIIFIPKIGVFNFFQNTNEKLRILNHTSTEILYEEKKKEQLAQSWIETEVNEKQTDKQELSYVD